MDLNLRKCSPRRPMQEFTTRGPGNPSEIGGTEEQVEKDLKDMKRKGIIDEDCEISRYKVDIPIRP